HFVIGSRPGGAIGSGSVPVLTTRTGTQSRQIQPKRVTMMHDPPGVTCLSGPTIRAVVVVGGRVVVVVAVVVEVVVCALVVGGAFGLVVVVVDLDSPFCMKTTVT